MKMNDHTDDQTCGDSGCSGGPQGLSGRSSEHEDREAIVSRMNEIEHKIVVLSGKGGVGKSTVAVNLATALSMAGKRVGLLDVDVHGPNVPKMLHIEEARIIGGENGLLPVRVSESLWVMSTGFLMQNRDDAVIWRGPMKYKMIKQFLKDVDWGRLDYLIVDCPPGTGDEPLGVAQLIDGADGAIVVTTPQQVALLDVRRSIRFCQELELPVLGLVENMSGLVCPHCSGLVEVFGPGGGKAVADELDIEFLGTIPLDPRVVASGDDGSPVVRSDPSGETAKAFGRLVRTLLEPELQEVRSAEPVPAGQIKIAVPVAAERLCQHFGHCEHFAFFDVDPEQRTVLGETMLTPPAHEPGVLPRWLHGQGADLIIAGGMGSRAQSLFNQNQVKVVVGAADSDPREAVQAWLDGCLVTGDNVCDH